MTKVPVYAISLPEYRIDQGEPDHKAIGEVVDEEIKKHLMGQTILIRGLGSMEHPGRTIDELIKIIKTTDTDRYDPGRPGDRYANVQGKYIDFSMRFGGALALERNYFGS